jgi:hypothetical protein
MVAILTLALALTLTKQLFIAQFIDLLVAFSLQWFDTRPFEIIVCDSSDILE